MPVEQCCFQMKKSHSKGLGKHLSDEAAWPFPAGDGSQGLLDSSALIHQQWWEWGGCTPGAGSIPHPLVQGCHVQGQGLTVARAEQGPGSLSHPHWHSHILEGDTHQDGSASSVGTLQLQK